jgi:hypothetical protein
MEATNQITSTDILNDIKDIMKQAQANGQTITFLDAIKVCRLRHTIANDTERNEPLKLWVKKFDPVIDALVEKAKHIFSGPSEYNPEADLTNLNDNFGKADMDYSDIEQKVRRGECVTFIPNLEFKNAYLNESYGEIKFLSAISTVKEKESGLDLNVFLPDGKMVPVLGILHAIEAGKKETEDLSYWLHNHQNPFRLGPLRYPIGS